MKKEELTEAHIDAAAKIIKSNYGKKDGTIVNKSDDSEELDDTDIVTLLEQVGEEEWDELDSQLQTQYAKAGAKLQYLKKLKDVKKGKMGLELAVKKTDVEAKKDTQTKTLKKGGKKCACGCDTKEFKVGGQITNKCKCCGKESSEKPVKEFIKKKLSGGEFEKQIESKKCGGKAKLAPKKKMDGGEFKKFIESKQEGGKAVVNKKDSVDKYSKKLQDSQKLANAYKENGVEVPQVAKDKARENMDKLKKYSK